jgi:hypothetical protein
MSSSVVARWNHEAMNLLNRIDKLERRGEAPEGILRFHVGVIEAATREEWERAFARRVGAAGESELIFTVRLGDTPGEESEGLN